jgi:hypothetical protein
LVAWGEVLLDGDWDRGRIRGEPTLLFGDVG